MNFRLGANYFPPLLDGGRVNGVQRGAQGQGVYTQPDRRRERRDTSRKIDLACILEAAVSIVAQFVPQGLGLGDYSPEACPQGGNGDPGVPELPHQCSEIV